MPAIRHSWARIAGSVAPQFRRSFGRFTRARAAADLHGCRLQDANQTPGGVLASRTAARRRTVGRRAPDRCSTVDHRQSSARLRT